MNRFNIVLLVALVVSSLYLVRTSYEARSLFVQLDRANSEARQLEIDLGRLTAERQTQATPLRVERVAREKLAMRTADPTVTQYVNYTPPAASAAGAAPAGGAR